MPPEIRKCPSRCLSEPPSMVGIGEAELMHRFCARLIDMHSPAHQIQGMSEFSMFKEKLNGTIAYFQSVEENRVKLRQYVVHETRWS